jgi:transposase
MVAAVRAGKSWRSVAGQYRCSVGTVGFWVRRAAGRRLDRVDWSDRSSGPAIPANHTPWGLERRVVRLRRWLANHDPLGYVGPEAIRRKLLTAAGAAPAARTIARILHRAGLTPQKRQRHPPPPPGWYLPEVGSGLAELDQLDVVEGLRLRGLGMIEVLTGVSLWGKLALAEPIRTGWHIDTIRPVLAAHWRQWGAPTYLQMDNDPRFAGTGRAPRRLGRLIRFCLAEGVVPVFVPPRETGFQAAIESFNWLWQAKVWQRYRHRRLGQLHARNQAFLAAHRQLRLREQPGRRGLPRGQAREVVFLRRTDGRGRIHLLGVELAVSTAWPHRLVRVVVDVRAQRLRIYALRRRLPTHQPLLLQCSFKLCLPATF